MGTIGMVMLIACANVANLFLVRVEARRQEFAVRAALGAGWRRIICELLLESVLLSFLGGALGLGLACAALRGVVSLGPGNLPRLAEVSVDSRALAFTFGLSFISGILFGSIAALKYAQAGLSLELRSAGRTTSGSREQHRTRDILVIAQVALAIVLLIGSGLMIRTFQHLRMVHPGFTHPETIQTMRIFIPPSLVSDQERVARAQNEMLDKLTAIPGVEAVGFASGTPMDGLSIDWDAIHVEGRTDDATPIPPLRTFKTVSPGLFRAFGTRLTAGRDFTWTDLYDRRPVVMLSENLGREIWGSAAAAIGKRIRASLPTSPWREVIGVVEDVHERGVQEPAPAIVYWPTFGDSKYAAGQIQVARAVTFAIRCPRAGSASLLTQMQETVWSVNASLPVAAVHTMRDVYNQSMARTSFTLVMVAIVGLMALVLGIIGIYGVIAYAVSQRKREIGIRLALGASPAEVSRMFLHYALTLAGIGALLGIAASTGLIRLMKALVFGVSPLDPLTFTLVVILLLLAAVCAAYLPAGRAAAVNPAETLRAE
jgi:predicted permease